MKNIFLPLVFVIVIAGLLVWGGSSMRKEDTSSSEPSSSEQTTASADYFDENAKVQFFYSDTCSWCNKQKTILEDLAKEGYRVKPMDVGKNQNYWTDYSISGTPAFIAPDGQRLEGYKEKEELKVFLDKYK